MRMSLKLCLSWKELFLVPQNTLDDGRWLIIDERAYKHKIEFGHTGILTIHAQEVWRAALAAMSIVHSNATGFLQLFGNRMTMMSWRDLRKKLTPMKTGQLHQVLSSDSPLEEPWLMPCRLTEHELDKLHYLLLWLLRYCVWIDRSMQ